MGIESAGKGQPSPETKVEQEKPSSLNIFSDYANTIAALRQLEGDAWLAESEFSRREYSLGHVYNSVLEGDLPDRTIYGKGGVHRFVVGDDGTIHYSKMHGVAAVDQAKKLGFTIS